MSTIDESNVRLLDDFENNETDEPSIVSKRPMNSGKMTNLLKCLTFITFLLVFVLIQVVISQGNTSTGFYSTENDGFHFINDSNPEYTYECNNNKCVRRLTKKDEPSTPLAICNMLCNGPSLWPKPKKLITNTQQLSAFKKKLISVKLVVPKSVENDLEVAITIFSNNLPSTVDNYFSNITGVLIQIVILSEEIKIREETDETYKLTIKKNDDKVLVQIQAETYFGARHGLETLSQLIIYDDVSNQLKIYHDIEIQDGPAFPYRGLMVDTARNFFPPYQLLKVLDGMSMNKLNVFHLHLTDSVSFPIELPRNPWLAKFGAYSPSKIYTAQDIKTIIEYARIRGIRVILEIDVPAHANEGWRYQNTKDDQIIICGENDVFEGHLNPDSERAQYLLESIYTDLLELGTDKETFHIGGDEVSQKCLSKTKSARKINNWYRFWADYVNKIFNISIKAFQNTNNKPPKNMVIWSSDLTDNNLHSLEYSGNLVIQYWFGNINAIINKAKKIIYSTVGRWYLDCGFGSWRPSKSQGSCDPYTPWQTFYNYQPWFDLRHKPNQVLGGEVCLWTEQVSTDALETRIWPRTAAFAERIWSDLITTDLDDVSTRLSDQRERMIFRRIKAAAVWPEWCSKNPGKCL